MPQDNQREILLQAMGRLPAGDKAALQTVYELTSNKLFGTIIRIVRGRERAEDLLQDVYVKIWQRAGRYDPARGSPIAWLCTIARNTALNDLRREKRSKELGVAELPEIADDGLKPSDQWLCDMEDSEALRRCIEELQQDHRRSIKLAFFEGYTYSEVADYVSVPIGTMKSWIRRGLAGLKGCLGG